MSSGSIATPYNDYVYSPIVQQNLLCGRRTFRVWSGGDSPEDHGKPNSYYTQKVTEFIPKGFYNGYPIVGTGLGSARPSVENDPNETLKLMNKLIGKTRQHEFNAAVSVFAEGHQTLMLIGNTARVLAKAIRHVKRGNLSAAAQALGLSAPPRQRIRYSKDRAADMWLQLQYGWIPLYKDTLHAAEALAVMHAKPARIRFSAGVRLPKSYVDSNSVRSNRVMLNYSRRMTVELNTLPSPLDTLGFLDPQSVIWEAVPFSFVVDWFLPIGTMLDTIGAVHRLDAKWFIDSTITDFSVKSLEITPAYSMRGDYEYQQFTLNRVVSSSVPAVPLPTIKPLSQALSFKHAVSGIALINNLFLRR